MEDDTRKAAVRRFKETLTNKVLEDINEKLPELVKGQLNSEEVRELIRMEVRAYLAEQSKE